MKPQATLRRALSDRNLLGATLASDSWRAWRVLLIAAMGEPLTEDERVLFTQLTDRPQEPLQRVEEFVGVIGRRGGKSRAIAVLATYIAALCSHTDTLVPGETGLVLIIAPDQRQALIVLEYIAATFAATPILSQLVASRTADTLTLTNRVSIEVRSASFRRLRGPTYLAVISDEAAFWHSDESANPDVEILNAVRPGLATTNGLLAIISSPYARRGVVWDAWRSHYGPAGGPPATRPERAHDAGKRCDSKKACPHHVGTSLRRFSLSVSKIHSQPVPVRRPGSAPHRLAAGGRPCGAAVRSGRARRARSRRP
jgi:hypothetical protein